MRRLIIIVVVGLVLMGAGCSRHEDDARLVRADALMASRPDSALAILDGVAAAIDSGTLTFDEADAAYYALLLTQARYRCYVPATSDTLITRALRYYQRHPQGDRLPRALLYRGTVAEELNDPTAAITWYRQAESATPADNHALLGYIHLRAASLYVTEMANARNPRATQHVAAAIEHLQRDTAMSSYLIDSYDMMGELYYNVDNDSAALYFHRALSLAMACGDSTRVPVALNDIIIMESNDHDYAAALRHADELITSYRPYSRFSMAYYYRALSLHELGREAEAWRAWDSVPMPQSVADSAAYLLARSRMAENTENSREYRTETDEYSDSVYMAGHQAQMLAVEGKLDMTLAESHHTRRLWVTIVVSMVVLCFVIGWLVWRKRRSEQARARELLVLQRELSDLQSSVGNESESVKHRLAMNMHYRNALAQLLHANAGESRIGRAQTMADVLHPDFWTRLHEYVDATCGGMYTHYATHFTLTDADLNLLCLSAINLPNKHIMLLLDLKSEHYVTNKKSYLLKNKLHTTLTMQQLVEVHIKSTH